MTIRIFLDDEREPVNSRDYWIIRNYSAFVTTVLNFSEPIDFISFDHDLGEDSLDGYEAVKWLCDLDTFRKGKVLSPDFTFYVHSQNPVGKKNIEEYLNGYLGWRLDNV